MTEPGSSVPDSHIEFASSSRRSSDHERQSTILITQAADDQPNSINELAKKFHYLVRNLSSELQRCNCSFDDIKGVLHKLVEESKLSIVIPADVRDMTLLCTHLCKTKSCLESDVDLLCELFKMMKQDKLEKVVTAYVNEIAMMGVVEHLPHQNNPTEQCFLMTTVHDNSTLKFREAFRIKKCLSNLLHIQQHVFALVGAKSGSVSLVWQVPIKFKQQAASTFIALQDTPMAMPTLFLNEHCLTCVSTLKANSEPVVVFSKLSKRYHAAAEPIQSANPRSAIRPFTAVPEQESSLITKLHLEVHKTVITKDVDKYKYAAIAPEQGIGQSATDTLKLEKYALKGAPIYSQDSDSKFTYMAVQEDSIPATEKSLLSYEYSESTECQRPVQKEEIPFSIPPPIMQSHAIMQNPADMNSAPTFHCPCHECSLTTYLSDGCPKGFFPYLELSKLDEDQKDDLIQRLSQETEKMIDSFCALLANTRFSLKAYEVTPLELACRVLELPAYISPNTLKPLMSDKVEELKNSRTIEESFLILQPHMSFFNFKLLKHIIEGKQTGSDEDRQQLEEYCKKFELYCRRRIVEVPPGTIGQSSTNLVECKRRAFVITSDEKSLAELSLDDARKVKREIANILGLQSSTLYLHRIEEGSLIFVFSIPEFVAQELLPLNPSLKDALKKNGFYLFAVCATNQDTKKDFHLDTKSESISKEYDHQILNDRFNELVSRTCDYLVSGFRKLLQQVISIEGLFSFVEQAKLKEANTTADIFKILENHWDFVNYSLLKFILDQGDNEELQKQMDVYVDALFEVPITTILVTKESPPSNFSSVMITLLVDLGTTFTLQNFETYRQKLQETIIPLEGGMTLRTEKINLEARVAVLSLPRQCVPHLLDLFSHIQEVTIEAIDDLAIEDYVKYFEDKPCYILEAAKRGLTEVTKTMLFADKELVNEHNKEGNTALMFAAMSGSLSTLKVLIDSGAHVNKQNQKGETALMLAVIHKHTDIIKHLLFEAKADPNIAREDDGFTALKWAAQYVLTDVLEYLIEAGADVNKHYGGWTALMSAAYHATPEVIGILIDSGAIVDMTDLQGMSALMWAARKDEQAEAVNKLISAGADMNLKNREGKTALMLAAECGCARNIHLILTTQAQGADSKGKGAVNLDLKDNKGESAIVKARSTGHEEIEIMLKEAGADIQQLEGVEYIERKFILEEGVQFGYHDDVCGTNIKLSGEKYTVASRKEKHSTENGITYSARPLEGTVEFEIEIIELDPEPKKGSMSLGVMRVTKGLQLFGQDPVRISRGFANSCIWNTGKVYNTLDNSQSDCISRGYGYVDLASLKKGDRVGFQLSSCDGSLSFYFNQKHQGFATKGIYDDKYDVYAVVEHTGGCISTKITQAVMHEPDLQDLCVAVIIKSLSSRSQIANLRLPAKLEKKITTLSNISQYHCK